MARIRSIKPDFYTDEAFAELPPEVRLTLIGLWTYVDDFGNGLANPRLIKAALYPLDDDVTRDVVDEHLLMLAEAAIVSLYTVEKRTFLHVVDWEWWQKVDRPSRSPIPPPEAATEPSDPLARENLASPREPLAGEGRGGGESVREGARAGGGEREGEPESEPARLPTFAPAQPPSPFCTKHPGGIDGPCRACGNARNRRKLWDDEQLYGPPPNPETEEQ